MNKLEYELQRLYCLPGQAMPNFGMATGNLAISLLTGSELARCFVISVEKGVDWAPVIALCQGVQEDLDLPAPAISVSADEGYQIWFSMAEPLPLPLMQDFMKGLASKYLSDIKALKFKCRPGKADELRSVPFVPAKQGDAERWSAFVDPTMVSMFVEETWLEMAPGADKQAAMLVGLESISLQDFQRALSLLRSPPEANARSSGAFPTEATIQVEQIEQIEPQPGKRTLDIGRGFTSPKRFLLAVMNDRSASADQRIAAAVALLPFCEKNDGSCP